MKKGLYAKTCFRCKTEKDSSLFFNSSNTSDGLHSWCKTCCETSRKESQEKKYSCFENRVTTFLRTCKISAEKRKQEFSLTREDLIEAWEQQGGICAYTGFEMTTQAAKHNSVSVERVNNTVGYTKENTILVCNAVNRMKTNLEYSQFVEYCKAVSDWLTLEDGSTVEGKKYG